MTVLRDKLTDVATSVSDSADELRSQARDAWDNVGYRTNRALRKSATYVHKNPVSTALTAFGVGFVLGTFLSRCDAGPFKMRHIEQSSRGVPVGMIVACATLLRSIFSSGARCSEAKQSVREEHSRIAPGYAGEPAEVLAGSRKRTDRSGT